MLPKHLALKPNHAKIWRAIAAYQIKHGYVPSTWELMSITGDSTSVINYALKKLAEKGYVRLAPKNERGYRPARAYRLIVWPMEVTRKVS